MMNKEQIKEIIPYNEPFLFVDQVSEINENKIFGKYLAEKSKDYFKGHFVDFKIMPGVLIIEGLAQLSSIVLRKNLKADHKNYFFLAYEVNEAKFFKPVFPGAEIMQTAEILNVTERNSTKIATVKAEAKVNKDIVCSTNFSIAIIEKQKFIQKQ